MKLNDWSVVPTADNKGVACFTDEGVFYGVEVCVASRNGNLEINVHTPGFDEPFSRISIPLSALERS